MTRLRGNPSLRPCNVVVDGLQHEPTFFREELKVVRDFGGEGRVESGLVCRLPTRP